MQNLAEAGGGGVGNTWDGNQCISSGVIGNIQGRVLLTLPMNLHCRLFHNKCFSLQNLPIKIGCLTFDRSSNFSTISAIKYFFPKRVSMKIAHWRWNPYSGDTASLGPR